MAESALKIVHATAAGGVGATPQVVSRGTLTRLLDDKIIDQEQMDIVLAQQRHLNALGVKRRVGDITLDNFFADADRVAEAISGASGQDAGASSFQMLLPIELCLKYSLIPARVTDSGVLIVQSVTKLEQPVMDLLMRAASGYLEREITGIHLRAGSRSHVERELTNLKHASSSGLGESLAMLESDPESGEYMKRVIKDLFLTAASRRASDIHLIWNREIDEGNWIKFRVDGVLRAAHLMSQPIAAAISRRLKDAADMDASESRRQQDGRYSFTYLSRKIDIRMAAQPTVVGETLVMRLLDPSSLRSLNHLFPGQPEICDYINSVTGVKGKEGGIMVVSGATGQGKTTTLYAMIRALARHKLHVVSIEDPVEFTFPFVTQIQFDPNISKSIADSMKGVMREDPDIIVVGEIRDGDTTELALRAAQSGHLILTTLHTTDAFQIYERLLDLHPGGHKEAVLPLANTLRGAMHQVLAQRLCLCAVPRPIPQMHPLRMAYGIETSMQAMGCERCAKSGYLGRVAIPEAIFIAPRESVRTAVIAHLRGGGNLRDMPDIDGVKIFRRVSAICELLQKGLIDLSWASRILGIEFVSTAKPVMLASSARNAPWHFERGALPGLSTELATRLSALSKGQYDFQLTYLPRSRINGLLLDGAVVVIPWVNPDFYGDSDMEMYAWSPPLLDEEAFVVSPKARPVKLARPSDLIGKRFSAVEGSVYPAVTRYVDSGEIVREDAAGMREALLKLLSGRNLDFAIFDRTTLGALELDDFIDPALLYITKLPTQYDYTRHILAPRGNPELAAFLSSAVEDLSMDSGWRATLAKYGVVLGESPMRRAAFASRFNSRQDNA